jgi:nicotinamide-nucleotide amidase
MRRSRVRFPKAAPHSLLPSAPATLTANAAVRAGAGRYDRRVGTRAGVVVTGTEVLTGRVADRNGPWLAEQLRRLGIDIAQVIVVGDRPDDLRASLAFLADGELDLIITSGGLGPTADDLTAQVVAEFQGRALVLDPALEAAIGEVVARLAARRGWRMDPAATASANRKQAMVPDGARVLAPVGTAPGLVVPPAAGRAGPPVLVLPGPPSELQAMWPAALQDPAVRQVLAAATELRQRTLRLWGTPESELAATLRAHQDRFGGLEITTCLRDGELEIVTRYAPAAEHAYLELRSSLEEAYPRALFSTEGETVDEIVARALLARKLTVATAESCTAGLLAARLTDLPGSSRYVLGGVVSYANAVKADLVGVDPALIERHGAVSPEVAAAMAHGARQRLGAGVGIGITGIAGPGGGSADKPVGLVQLCVTDGSVTMPSTVQLPGSRAEVRARTVSVALHLLRRFLDPRATDPERSR